MNDLKPKQISEFLLFARKLAENSGTLIAKYFRKPVQVDLKADQTPVTIADREAEMLMRDMIIKTYPDHGIIGEEGEDHNPDSTFLWILDPIDGTKSFVCGAVTFGTLIGLLYNKRPLIGTIHLPVLRELLNGDNQNAWLNGKKVRVRSCDKLNDATLLTTDYRSVAEEQDLDKFHQLVDKVHMYRHLGDCYGYYLLATGFADIMTDPIMSPWDSLPLIPVVKGAGGIITDWQGNDPVDGSSIVAAAPAIHPSVVEILNR